MAACVGQVNFVHLSDSFAEPRWREALVVGQKEEWLQLVVRARSSSEIPEGVSQFTLQQRTFFLLECPATELRVVGATHHLQLEALVSDLIQRGKNIIETDSELIYATASEPERKKKAPAPSRLPRRQSAENSDSESSSTENENDDLGRMLSGLKKNWQGGGTGKGKSSKEPKDFSTSRRFAYLNKDKDSKQKRSEDADPMLKIFDSLNTSGDPIRALLAVQLAQSMEAKKRRSKHRRKSSSSSRSAGSHSETSDTDSSQGPGKRRVSGHAKTVDNYLEGKRRMFRRPLHHVRKYVREVERTLGATDRPFRLSEMGRRIQWGKQKSLQRVHYMLSEILELMVRGKMDRACLQTVLCLRSIHQAAIDQDWSVAWMVSHLEDVFSKPKWGGEINELANVTAYLRSMAELERSTEKLRSSASASTDRLEKSDDKAAPSKKPNKKGKGKGKSDKNEKDEEATDRP
jgi:hypothetical protein